MLNLSVSTSVPKSTVVSGLLVYKMFASVGARDPYSLLSQLVFDLTNLSYDEQAVPVAGQDSARYSVMTSMVSSNEFPMVVLYVEGDRIYIMAVEKVDYNVAREYLAFVLENGSKEIASLQVKASSSDEYSVLRVQYEDANDKQVRRDTIDCVSEVTAGFNARAKVQILETGNKVFFDITGPEHRNAVKAITAALKRGYKGLTLQSEVAKVKPGLARRVTARRVTKRIVKAVAAVKAETAGVFDDAAVAVGDRVIINNGTAKEPIYLVGTVHKVYPQKRRIEVMLDSGALAMEQIDNGPTGMLGFTKQKRTKIDPIRHDHLAHWLDRTRWLSDSAMRKILLVNMRPKHA